MTPYVFKSNYAVTPTLSCDATKIPAAVETIAQNVTQTGIPVGILLQASSEMVIDRTTLLSVFLKSKSINWQPNKDYSLTFSQGFTVDKSGADSPEYIVTFNSGSVLGIESSIPPAGATATTVNDYIKLTFNRNPILHLGRYIRLYQSDNTLIKTFDIRTDTFNGNPILNGRILTLDVRGFMRPNTNYYLLSDANLFQELGFFYYSITSNTTFAFKTADQPDFHDFIALQQSSGVIVINNIRNRRSAVALQPQFVWNFARLGRIMRPGTISMRVWTRMGPAFGTADMAYWDNNWPIFGGQEPSSISYALKPIVGKIIRFTIPALAVRVTMTTNATKAKFTSGTPSSTFNIVANGNKIRRFTVNLVSTPTFTISVLKLKRTNATFTSVTSLACDAVKTQRALLFSASSLTASANISTRTNISITARLRLKIRVYMPFASGPELAIDNPLAVQPLGTARSTQLRVVDMDSQTIIATASNEYSGFGDQVGVVYLFNTADGLPEYTFTNPSSSAAYDGSGWGEAATLSSSQIAISMAKNITTLGPLTWLYNRTTKTAERIIQDGGQRLYVSQISGQADKLSIFNTINQTASSTQARRDRGIRVYNLTTGSLVQDITVTSLDETGFSGFLNSSSPALSRPNSFAQVGNLIAIGGNVQANLQNADGFYYYGNVHVFDITNNFASKLYTIKNPLPFKPITTRLAGDASGTSFGNNVKMDEDYIYIYQGVYAGNWINPGVPDGNYSWTRSKFWIYNKSNGSFVGTLSDPETRVTSFPGPGSYDSNFQILDITTSYIIAAGRYFPGDTNISSSQRVRYYVYNRSNLTLAYSTEVLMTGIQTTADNTGFTAATNDWVVRTGPAPTTTAPYSDEQQLFVHRIA